MILGHSTSVQSSMGSIEFSIHIPITTLVLLAMKSPIVIMMSFSQEHANYISRDSKVGPVLLSIKIEQDYQGTLYRALLRIQKKTFYKVMQKANLPDHMEPEDFIKVCVCVCVCVYAVDKITRYCYVHLVWSNSGVHIIPTCKLAYFVARILMFEE